MNATSLSQELYEFAIELRKLAYTMPGGCEDPMIRLSERMVLAAAEQDDRGTASTAVRSPEMRAAGDT